MKKSWMFLLITPVVSLSAAFPIYEEFETHEGIDHEFTEEIHSEEWDQEVGRENAIQEDTLVYDDEIQGEEIYVAPPQRSRSSHKGNLSASPKREPTPKTVSPQKRSMKRNSIKSGRSTMKGGSARTRMKDARMNSNRPRVTHRDQEQNLQNTQQIEADVQTEESSTYDYQTENRPRSSSSAKTFSSQAMAEKRATPAQRRSGYASKTGKARKYYQKKSKQKAKSHHPGKRPLGE